MLLYPRLYQVSLLISLVLLTSACGSLFGPEADAPTPSPTALPVPTFTPTNTPSEIPTALPTPVPEATQAPAPADAQADADSVNATSDTEGASGEADISPISQDDNSTIDESTQAAGENQPVKTLGSLLNTESTESTESAEPAESTESVEVTESAESAELAESTEQESDGADNETSEADNSEVAELASEEQAPSTEPLAVVVGEIVNVRGGPSTAYDLVGSASADEQFSIVGRNEQGDWWQVCCFNEDQRGWLYGPLVQIQNVDNIAVAVDIPPLPTPAPTAIPVAVEATPPLEEAAPEEANVGEVVEPATEPAAPSPHSATAGNFDPNAQFHIVRYHVRGFDENNGGIFNNGGQHMIFITVLDENGNGIDGAVVKDTLADDFTITTGSKGPGKTEFEMFWEPYKLTVASIPSGPVTSQITNQMNTAKPHIPDIIGKMGPPDHEYAICPTPDDRCEPPFFHAHWSYEITFQKVK